MANDDYILILQLNNGSKKAFVELYDKYAGKIYNYVHAMLRDKSLAEDITQLCFMMVWEKRTEIAPDRNFAAYLYVIARNAVYKETRSNVVAMKYFQSRLHQADEDSTSRDVDHSILQAEIDRIIESEPDARRRIYTMSTKLHFTNEEIANQLGISVKTVQNQLDKTLLVLRKKLAFYSKN